MNCQTPQQKQGMSEYEPGEEAGTPGPLYTSSLKLRKHQTSQSTNAAATATSGPESTMYQNSPHVKMVTLDQLKALYNLRVNQVQQMQHMNQSNYNKLLQQQQYMEQLQKVQ